MIEKKKVIRIKKADIVKPEPVKEEKPKPIVQKQKLPKKNLLVQELLDKEGFRFYSFVCPKGVVEEIMFKCKYAEIKPNQYILDLICKDLGIERVEVKVQKKDIEEQANKIREYFRSMQWLQYKNLKINIILKISHIKKKKLKKNNL